MLTYEHTNKSDICLKHTNLKKEKEQRNMVFFPEVKALVEKEQFFVEDEKDEWLSLL